MKKKQGTILQSQYNIVPLLKSNSRKIRRSRIGRKFSLSQSLIYLNRESTLQRSPERFSEGRILILRQEKVISSVPTRLKPENTNRYPVENVTI